MDITLEHIGAAAVLCVDNTDKVCADTLKSHPEKDAILEASGLIWSRVMNTYRPTRGDRAAWTRAWWHAASDVMHGMR
jgi:hypothetical protein